MEGTLSAAEITEADTTKVLGVRDEGRDPDSAVTNHPARRGRIACPLSGARRFAISPGRRGVDEDWK